MQSRNWKRLVTWFAFAAAFVLPCAVFTAALTFPSTALAAILPACEDHQVTAMPPEWLAPTPTLLPDACTLGELVLGSGEGAEDGGDPRVAAMCSDLGASMVAPPRLVPVIDARLDAAPGCASFGDDSGSPALGGPQDMPLGPPAFAVIEHAALGASEMVPPASFVLAPPFAVVPGAPRAGVEFAIDHPPR